MTTEKSPHFSTLTSVWHDFQLPLKPHEPVPTRLKALLPESVKHALILGVTPEYAALDL